MEISVTINGVSQMVAVSKLEALPDGTFAEHYNEDGTIDTITESKLKQEQSVNAQIQKAKAYLADTGWIWEKYNRNVLVLKDMTTEEFNLKYSDIINKQEEYRALINELEVQLGGN